MSTDRDALSDWVYAERQLMTSFDATLLEQHATAQLARALNTRRLLAVIGSGVSAGYGQPSWGDILSSTMDLLDGLLTRVKTESGPLFGEAKAISDSYESLGKAWRKKEPAPDEFPVAFEVCENLYAALHVHQAEKSTGRIARRAETRRALAAFRDRLKWQLRDERGRLEFLIARLQKRGDEATREGLDEIAALISYPLDLEITQRSRDERLRAERFVQRLYHSVPGGDDPDGADIVIEALDTIDSKSARGTLAGELKKWISAGETAPGYDAPKNGTGVQVRPHLIEAALELLGPADALCALQCVHGLVAYDEIDSGNPTASDATLDTVVRSARTRRAALPRHRDPIAVLLDELKIKRFLTTNYDGEIDRLLEARGHAPVTASTPEPEANPGQPVGEDTAAPSRTILMDASFGRAEILAYEPGAAAYLFDYGADTREQGIKILHLHGRARSRKSWLVLSERDYRERYARDDDPRAQADDAMRLVFTANPLLFLGLGMREPDILRPLREFSEDVSRLCDRPAIALLPRTGDKETQAMLTASTLARYGVYTLHYGTASITGKEETDPDFMSNLLDVQKAIDRRLQGKDSGNAQAHLETLAKAGQVRLIEGGTAGLAPVHAVVTQLRVLLSKTESEPDADLLPAIKTLNRGIYGVVLTTFMTAWLQQTVGSWREWHEAWSSAPNPRERGGSKPTTHVTESGAFLEVTRHRTLLRNLDDEMVGQTPRPNAAPSTDRFFAGAPSPAFQVLRASMDGEQIAKPSIGRRTIYLLSERGTGRGHVFSAMRSPRRFARLCDWLRITAPDKSEKKGSELSDPDAHRHTANVSRAFLNFGMSHEVISSFDRLTRFLEEFALGGPGMQGEPRRFFEQNCKSLRSDRIGRLQYVLKTLAKEAAQAGAAQDDDPPQGGVRRAVIVINHFDVLFDSDGRTKNAQIGKLFEILTDSRYETAPLDFIFMMNEHRLPKQLREACLAVEDESEQRGMRASDTVALLEPTSRSAEERREIEQRCARAFGAEGWMRRRKKEDGLREADRQHASMREKEEGEPKVASAKRDYRTYVHFLRWMRPVTLATRFFPRTAVALAHIANVKAEDSDLTSIVVSFSEKPPQNSPVAPCLGFADGDEVRAFQHTIRKAFEDALANDGEDGSARSQRLGASFGSDAIEDAMLGVLRPYVGESGVFPPAERRLVEAEDAVESAVARLATKPHQSASKISSNEREQRDYFRRIASAVGHSRYAMTLVLAAVDDMIARRMKDDPTNLVDLAPIAAFLDRLKLSTAGKAPGIREDIAIAQALQLYQTDGVSSLGRKLPAWPVTPTRCTNDTTWKKLENIDHALLFSFQRAILVTLALIGQPVDASVLTGVDSVARLLQQVGKTCGFDQHDEVAHRECLHAVLDLLVHRCLVFRIARKGDETEEGASAWHRFATHKSLRRHIFHEINAPGVDFAEVDQLTVSMYATQPSELPRPTAEGHRRVRRLIEQLSCYERRDDEPAHRFCDPFLGDGTDKQIARSRLRAAYGALRSIYSIAVVARFSKYEDEGLDAPENGFFENHRLRVRWMLRRANQLDKRLGSALAVNDKDVRTFHAEEIVWLFNECGVLSLVEGRINDAVALLAQARRTARDLIEHSDWGPLIARIGLNRAIGNIVRGRPGEAADLLANISREHRDEHPSLLAIVRGYQALVRDMRGDPVGAIDEYEKVIVELVELKRYRAAAIFAIQRSEASRSLGPLHAEAAIAQAALAGQYAVEGGHEDIRRIAQLAQVSATIAKLDGTADIIEAEEIEKQLQDVLAYAKLMGMPRLVCRVALARGEFFLNHGDYRMTAELAQHALALATRHEIETSKISALRLLGIAMLRLERTAARTLLVRARELAYLADFRSEVTRIERALAEI